MANPEHLAILKQGVEAWNEWRKNHAAVMPNLSCKNLSFSKLKHIDFSRTNLFYVDLSDADLEESDLSDANLSRAILSQTNLLNANLSRASVIGANLSFADLSSAILLATNLGRSIFEGTIFNAAQLGETIFFENNLSDAIGLDECSHSFPSIIDHRTISASRNLSRIFLRGIGLPDNYIDYLPSLLNEPIQFYSCFISYSTANEDFAKRLHADLQDNGVRCWFAPEDMKGGRKLHHQIDEGIKLHDKLILILSEESMASDWVQHEIKQTRKREKEEGRQKLFPISVTEFGNIAEWELFDSATVTNLADEVRSYFIPDFSNWKNHDSYHEAFDRLLRDLKA